MAYYMSMQTIRFRSPNDYEQFKMLLSNVDEHLKKLDGFVHLTWWAHPEDPNWFNEISIWTSKEATDAWHANGYHKYLKQWGVSGPAIENMVTNWECVESKIMRVCPVCGQARGESFDPILGIWKPERAGDLGWLPQGGIEGRVLEELQAGKPPEQLAHPLRPDEYPEHCPSCGQALDAPDPDEEIPAFCYYCGGDLRAEELPPRPGVRE